MATVAYTVEIPKDKNGVSQYGSLLISWLGLTETNNVGEPFDLVKYNEHTVHLYGDDGTGGHIEFEGTNVPNSTTDADYVTLKGLGTAADLDASTAPILDAVIGNPLRVRPHITAGTSVNMNCRMLITSTNS